MAFDIVGPGLEGDGFISWDATNDEQTRVRTHYEAFANSRWCPGSGSVWKSNGFAS